MVENGSAIYFPDGESIVLGTPVPVLKACLAPFEGRLTDFLHCSLDEAMALTGLAESDCQAARERVQPDRTDTIYTRVPAPEGWSEGIGTALALLKED